MTEEFRTYSTLPDGWQLIEAAPTDDAAWAEAIEYKEDYERVHPKAFVRIGIMTADRRWGLVWAIARIEPRTD